MNGRKFDMKLSMGHQLTNSLGGKVTRVVLRHQKREFARGHWNQNQTERNCDMIRRFRGTHYNAKPATKHFVKRIPGQAIEYQYTCHVDSYY